MNRKRGEMLMRQAGIQGIYRRHGRRNLMHTATEEDLVKRAFTVAWPDALWLTDITEHPAGEGKLYCAAVSCKIIGWSIAARQDTGLVINGLPTADQAKGKQAGEKVKDALRKRLGTTVTPAGGRRDRGQALPSSGVTVARSGRRLPAHGAELARSSGLPGGQSGAVRPPDVRYPAELFGQPDDAGRDIDLALEHSVPGAGRIAVVEVVPGLAEGQDRQPRHVP